MHAHAYGMRVSPCDKLRKHHARLRQARRGLGCSSAANVHGYDATLAPMGTSREEQVLLSRIVCTRVRARIAYNIASSIESGSPCVWVADVILFYLFIFFSFFTTRRVFADASFGWEEDSLIWKMSDNLFSTIRNANTNVCTEFE